MNIFNIFLGLVIVIIFVVSFIFLFWLAIAISDICPRIVSITEAASKLADLKKELGQAESLDAEYKYKKDNVALIARKIKQHRMDIGHHWNEIKFSMLLPWHTLQAVASGIKAMKVASVVAEEEQREKCKMK